MRAFVADNLFVFFFVLAFLLVTLMRFLRWKRTAVPRNQFFNFVSIAISIGISCVVGGLLVLIYVGFIISDVNNKVSNMYSEMNEAKPRITLADSGVYENIGPPNYLGKRFVSAGLKKYDTVYPLATFQKGSLFTGTKYLLVNYKAKQFWMPEKSCLTYFDFAYDTQNLEFVSLDANQNAVFWERAQEYTQMYQKYHSKEDRIDNISNDTLIMTTYYNYNGNKCLKISRKIINDRYEYTVYAPQYKGSETSIVNGISTPNKRISNSATCAYYIKNGNFYRE